MTAMFSRTRLGLVAVAVAALAILCVAGTAGASTHKKKPLARSGPCHFGQDPKTCTANPLFGANACDNLNALVEPLMAPGVALPKAYSPAKGPNSVLCEWKANGVSQSVFFSMGGGKGAKIADLKSSFLQAYHAWFPDPGSTCPRLSLADAQAGLPNPPALDPVMTTIEGFPAWTKDGCAQLPQPDSPDYQAHFWVQPEVQVLWGDVLINFVMDRPVATLDTTAQLIPVVEKIMSMYASAK